MQLVKDAANLSRVGQLGPLQQVRDYLQFFLAVRQVLIQAARNPVRDLMERLKFAVFGAGLPAPLHQSSQQQTKNNATHPHGRRKSSAHASER
ncbi:hypothetical protein [Rhodoferax sp.]|uniref:hypothetical protein n=1 Tax=Rhodoferax sp. TaxID=50421 RepID=UPI0025F237E6|nr:hypothetical protein [Rhodoferax sp.]MCM2295868.1 hypothetical protein [Rhodoferax sp.]